MRRCGTRVAVIDDGVYDKHWKDIVLKESYIVTDAGEVEEYWCQPTEGTHGTVCAAVMNRYAPDVSIVSLKVLNSTFEMGAIPKIITALKWCEEHKIKVCHLSIGITSLQYYEMFRKIVERMQAKGHIIIAAMANDNCYTLPACLPDVISVKEDNELSKKKIRRGRGQYGEPDFYALGEHVLADIEGKEIMITGGNSFAAPVVTAKVLEGKFFIHKKKVYKKGFVYLRQCFGEAQEVSIPVIAFRGRNKANIEKYAIGFREYLFSRQYASILASNYLCREKDLIVSVSKGEKLAEELFYVEKYFDVDAILLCLDDDEYSLEVDLCVDCDKEVDYEEVLGRIN